MSDRPADNSDQQAFWSTSAGKNWIAHQNAMDALLAPVLDLVLDRAALQPGETVLDIGCGAGTSTTKAADRVGSSGSALGLDISNVLLAHAQAQYGNRVTFVLADAQTYPFHDAAFDIVISRFGVMFFADSIAAFRNLGKALRPGGRMVFAAWGPAPHNPWFMIPARAAAAQLGQMPKTDRSLPGPFAFEDQERVIDILTKAGLTDIRAETCLIDLTPQGNALDAAHLCCQIGPAEKALQHFGASDTDAEIIAGQIAKEFAAMQMRIPANINLFTATKP
ncbi:methyltransferase domain-containing protein [Cognatiyoonia sp. IB215446]|uniref:class I SAM-dependent methyltransferase n=1 Tax=Cognatiyoonia sp. IB215446 TaxID=3097355 RepID=UPI002A1005B3|nr:methyltransferase domain-containing protein [Cognatiyoonia sp. IB215446]MDX8348796.1 methyltransferase domain-containing protein [Cognatiyoonia sp. IB215446]